MTGTTTDRYQLEQYERDFIASVRETITTRYVDSNPAYWFGRAAGALSYLPCILGRAAAAAGTAVTEIQEMDMERGRAIASCRTSRELIAWLQVNGFGSHLDEGERRPASAWPCGLGVARAILDNMLAVLDRMSE